jgi:predicted 3-demethylubiquinone-9 3-methyltransferase (glyoxalase superfamily)
MKQLTPCLWFDDAAEEAVALYTSIFKESRIGRVSRYTEAGFEFHGKPPGSVMAIEFELNGQGFMALNGGPMFRFNEAISFQVHCESQDEIDYYWEKLSEGGDEAAQQCGWLKDKFGLSWQVLPTALAELLQGSNPEKSSCVMQALLKMKKIDIAALEEAAERQ